MVPNEKLWNHFENEEELKENYVRANALMIINNFNNKIREGFIVRLILISERLRSELNSNWFYVQ